MESLLQRSSSSGKKKVLHKIESIIGFIDLHDVISINQHNGKKHHISFYGKFSKNIGKKNTVQKLFQILDKENLLKNKKFKVKIKKLIPQEAGLGGGSMNAASVFNYLVKKKIINPNHQKLEVSVTWLVPMLFWEPFRPAVYCHQVVE